MGVNICRVSPRGSMPTDTYRTHPDQRRIHGETLRLGHAARCGDLRSKSEH